MFTEQHLEDIKKSDVTLRGHCNAGTSFADEKGRYLDLFELWLVRHGIANLLSIPRLEKDGFRITYDTRTTWEIHCPDGKVIALKRDTGLCDRFPYLDMKEHKDEIAMLQMVPTVRGNFEGYTKRDIKDAIFARKAQANLGIPTQEEYTTMVSSSSGVKNIPVNPITITHDLDLFDPDLLNMRGKTVRGKPDRVRGFIQLSRY